MNFKRPAYLLLALSLSFSVFSQKFSDQVPQLKRYTAAQVTDPDYGIILFNKMVPSIGGDSIRYTKDGYNAQGWQEDYYVSGKLLHKGFYADGYIKIFKNFYENGQVERSLSIVDAKRVKMEVYYEDGKVRSTINFYDGNTQNQYDFFKNGSPEYVEENDKEIEFLYKRYTYFENGLPASTFDLVDKKAKKYMKKEFFENGRVKEEGTMYFRKDMGDYQKEGPWTYYDEKGNAVKTEKYHSGQLE